MPAEAGDWVIHAGSLLDGSGQPARHEMSILGRDDRILAVEPGFVSPAGAEVIDLSTATVMPGFIDCHVHISAMLPSRTNATEYWLTHNDIDRALDAAVFVREMLQKGFKSARDVGGGDETVSVRNAINDGKIMGPRLWVSLEPLGPTAGHGDRKVGLDAALCRIRAGIWVSWTARNRPACACASTRPAAPTSSNSCLPAAWRPRAMIRGNS